jgi:alpha-tubulin suppressor-like RCC1 family protein
VQRDPAPPPPTKPSPITDLVVGDAAACGRIGEDWWCWGATEPREVRGEEMEDVELRDAPPHVVPWMHGAKQVVLGYRLLCALKGDGSVWCLGDRTAFGQMPAERLPVVDAGDYYGYGTTDPLEMALPKASWLASSNLVTCARTRAGGTQCFGYAPGALSLPWKASGLRMRSIAATTSELCVLVEDGSVWCVSKGTNPRKLLDGVDQLAGGFAHACARRGGAVWCWGRGAPASPGVYGDGATREDQPTPRKVEGLPPVRELWVGLATSCAVTEDFRTWCWGYSERYASDPIGREVGPRPVAVLAGLSRGAMHETTGCAFDREGRLVCWGVGESPERVHEIVIGGR